MNYFKALNEAAGKAASGLADRIHKSPMGRRYASVRMVEAGERTTGSGRRVRYQRFILRGKGNALESIELLSTDRDFRTLCGVVMYKGLEPVKTAYFRNVGPTDRFLADLGSKQGLSETSTFMLIAQGIALLTSLVTLLFMGQWVAEKYAAKRDEDSAKQDAEKRLNAFLFQGQNGKEAAFDAYKTLTSYTLNVCNGKSRGMIVYGMPGTGKTHNVRRTLHFAGLQPEKNYVIVKGSSANPSQNIKIIYSTLYSYNGKIIVFDDFDSALEDANTVNLLKAALDSYPVRIVSMPDLAQFSAKDQPLPSRFEFTGRIIMITNKTRIDTALMSRTQTVAINFTPEEFERNIGAMLEFISPEVPAPVKKEVFQYLTECVDKRPDIVIDFRRFSSMLDLRLAYPDEWKELCMPILYPHEEVKS